MGFARNAILVFALAQPFDAFAATDPLLAAATFAVTGLDSAITYFSDRKNCIIEYKTEFNGWSNKEEFYLNNIDFSRLLIEKLGKTNDYPYPHTDVSIFGNDIVHDRISINANFPDKRESGKYYKIRMGTSEIDRLVRAWKYVYANGCKSAHSLF